MEKEKAEIAGLVERYGRVQSLMKYVNSDTLQRVLQQTTQRESSRSGWNNQGAIRRELRRKHRESACQNEEVFL